MPDALTGLSTHKDLTPELATGGPMALLVDVDQLIWLNDAFGHAAGDAALRAISTEARRWAGAQPGGKVFRVGGDEFLVVLPSAEPAQALELAASVVRSVHDLSILYRRANRPQQTCVEVNVLVLRLSRAVLMSFMRGLSWGLRDWCSTLINQVKQARNGEPGVVVDAHLLIPGV